MLNYLKKLQIIEKHNFQRMIHSLADSCLYTIKCPVFNTLWNWRVLNELYAILNGTLEKRKLIPVDQLCTYIKCVFCISLIKLLNVVNHNILQYIYYIFYGEFSYWILDSRTFFEFVKTFFFHSFNNFRLYL